MVVEAEQRLLVEVLKRAILDALGRYTVSTHDTVYHTMSARRWLDSPSVDIFSFLWICDHLDLDSATVRARVYALQDYEATLDQLRKAQALKGKKKRLSADEDAQEFMLNAIFSR